MSSTQEFEQYLGSFRQRLKQLVNARGGALLILAALVITLISVAISIRQGFPDDIVIGSRLMLLGVLVAIAWWFLVLPKRRVNDNGSDEIETRTPAFEGRVRTWHEVDGDKNPMAELLAEDSMRIAAAHPPEAQVPGKEFSLALGVAGAAAAALLFFAIAGPGNYAYGVRHLWFGWAFSDLLPPQSIEVSPGNDGIRKGGTVNVRAVMQGFEPGQAWVHARFGDTDWQTVEMADIEERFEFTFFSVREPLEYYVSAANVRSPTFEVNVVDLPVIENLSLTYRYPEWTERPDEVEDPGGDVRAIAETEVEVRITADRPMTAGDLVVDDTLIDLQVDGDSATASFKVQHDGQYFVAANVGGEQIRLTDDYFIKKLDDEMPTVEFARPGRDWSASSIEEVTARISAHDDYQLESLELRYSVNGGDWKAVNLPVDRDTTEYDHVFFLESLAESPTAEALVPGDLISYYAVAEDRENSARTDIFFIDVQPFDRRYSQSQQAGGGGQGGAPQQDEISQRQREIIVSTWNLIREEQENRRDDPAYVSDNAALLARVQSTLREQVETLARRTEARQLTASAEEIALFVENLEKAGAAMVPASERLGEMELEQAILPEQEALQHLLAAEAVFTDISVSMQSGNQRGGGGGQAGRDLSEMFELEMDLEKNQYETGSRATPEAPQQAMEEAVDELEELARRQEQLARSMNQNRTPSPAQRWQQEMLRRDVEELQDRLERMQQQSASNQAQQQGSQGQQSGSQSQNSSGQSTEQSGNPELNELQRRLESAIRAMNDADESMRNGGSPEESQRAADEAQRQLEGARAQASEEMQRAMQAAVDDLAERAREAYEKQAAMENELQEAIRGVNIGTNSLNRLDSGMTYDEELALAEQKRRLQAEVQGLEQDARNTAKEMADDQPGAADEIRDAIARLRETEIESRIAVAAAYIEQGEAVYVAGSESAVTEALRELRQDLDRARAMVNSESSSGPDGSGAEQGDGLAETLAETQQLRRELQQLAQGEAGGAQNGAVSNRGRDDLQQSTGVEVEDLAVVREFDRQADNISQDVISLFRDLRGRGVAVQDIDELRRLAADIRASEFSGNPALLEEEARRALAAVEQLEIALAKTAREGNPAVRTSAADEIPDQHRQIVADYYRRLGEVEE